MYEVLSVVYLLVALALIGLILIQQGKGADMGASFGAGASNTIFGASGAGNFLTKATTTLAILFFALSIFLGLLTTNMIKKSDEWENIAVPKAETIKTDTPASDIPKDENNDTPE